MEDKSRSEDERQVFPSVLDSSILCNFVLINCVEHLVCAFELLAITPRLRSEMSKRDVLASINTLIRENRIVVLEPTAEESFQAAVVFSKSAFGKYISETDRESIAVAKLRGLRLLFEDTPMRKVAREVGLEETRMFNTVQCLQKLVECGRLESEEAQKHFAKINEQRVIHRHPALHWEDSS
jgi:predicted nucleic acid-binding protein